MDDKEIIGLVLSGRKDEFGKLINKYSYKVYRLCLSLCGNGFDAEDAAQETFIDAFLYLPSLSEPEKFASWLYMIARRKSYRQIASRRTDEDIDEMAEFLPSETATPLDTSISSEKKRRIAEAMKGLSYKKRSVVELFYFFGMKISEISLKLSLSENTVKSRLYDAREFLRKELVDMNEYKDNMELLESKIKSRIEMLSRYYALNGGKFDEKFDREFDETIGLIEKIGSTETQQNYLASALNNYKRWSENLDDSERNSLTERMKKAAEDGKNVSVIADALVDDYFNTDDNNKVSFIDDIAIPKINEYAGTAHYDSALGRLLFWRGRTLLGLGKPDEAKADFEKAAGLIDKSESYYANAVAAMRETDYMKENSYDGVSGFEASAEGLLTDGDRLVFYYQPGFSEFFSTPGIDLKLNSFLYYASVCKRTLFDAGMKPNDKITDTQNGTSLECIAKDEIISVASGEFSGCLHMRTESEEYFKYTLDAWYAPNVGLVKVRAVCEGKTENYELTEYTIKGGKGYMPFAVGNRWVYKNPDIPDWSYQSIERTVEYTDGKLTTLSVISPFTLAKNFESSTNLDSSVYVGLAARLCADWKIKEAIEMLKKAIRLNISEQSVRISLYGIEVLERFLEYQKKGYRFCPSSINASTVAAGKGTVRFINPYVTSFGPYRLGARGRYEDRIFGIKPFRYLHQFMHMLWDDKWIPGYTEEKEIEDGLKLIFTVEDGGNVTVPAGSFKNCRKITLRVDKPADADDRWYFENNYSHMDCGVKEYWFAPGVGIVKTASSWGSECYAECLLNTYSVPASKPDEYLPIQIGNSWEYDEPHLTEEGYRAKAVFRIASGMNGEYLMTSSQEFVCRRTEDEYNEFVRISNRY
ncbi:MAG: RNA polymerase sigma factor [Firmicutes bacterium]|nr:RNA polymerase sigma factor [Bacillota bacterium]